MKRTRTTLIIVGAGFLLLVPVLFTAGFVTWILPEIYQSTARILPEQPVPAAGSASADMRDPAWIPTEIEILQSKAVLYKVIERLNLNREWAKKYKEAGDLRTEMSCMILKSMLDVRQSRNTSLIEIRVCSEKPAEAAQVANEIAKAYGEVRLEAKRARTGNPAATSAVEMLDPAVPALRPFRPSPVAKIGFFAGSFAASVAGLVFLIIGLCKPKAA